MTKVSKNSDALPKTPQKHCRRRINFSALNKQWAQKGFAYDPNVSYKEIASVGKMEMECQFCHALKFPGEAVGLCCAGGKVQLDELDAHPEPLYSLLKGDHQDSRHFRSMIRTYNSAFQMTSFGTHKSGKRSENGAYDDWSTYKVCGFIQFIYAYKIVSIAESRFFHF